jgi:hypothetical protein
MQRGTTFALSAVVCAAWALALTSPAQAQQAPGSAKPANTAATAPSRDITKPEWHELSAAEQTALKPLASSWASINEQQKRKWQAVAKSYATLPPTEQAKMHERMAEWSALTPLQRAQARRNFAVNREVTDGLTPEQRRVQWEAYQQLSPEEKRQLAEKAKAYAPAGAAITVRPQEPLKHQPTLQFGSASALAKTQAHKAAPKPGAKIAINGAVQPDGSLKPNAFATSAQPATPAALAPVAPAPASK